MAQPDFIPIGRIVAPWGRDGKLKVTVTTDFPERFTPSSTIYIDRQPMTIEAAHWQGGQVILKLDRITTVEAAQKLRGKLVEIAGSQVKPLPEGQFYHSQIIGLEVWTAGGERLGTVTEIMTTAGNDVYVVRGDKGEVLIPAIADVIKSIDLKRRRVIIEAIEGLLSEPQG
ncbi:MAG: 16S rRNA processing protein RimM [Chloroflexi bacterium]|nr:16S rRNA processing protein RimM [Chloroflexota bacterium]